MENRPVNPAAPGVALSAARRMSILQRLLAIALDLAVAELDAFSGRLSDAFLKHASQTVRISEAEVGRNAFARLKSDRPEFSRIVTERLGHLLHEEIASLDKDRDATSDTSDEDLSLVTFDEMESKVMLANVCQLIDEHHAELLAALTLRLARLLDRDDLTLAQNPFRPALLLQAIDDAWCTFDAAPESRALLLRLLRPDVVPQLQPVLRALNDALIDSGIELRAKARPRGTNATPRSQPPPSDKHGETRAPSPYHKLQHWLMAVGKAEIGGDHRRAVPRDLPSRIGGTTIAPALYGYLSERQKQLPRAGASPDADDIRAGGTILREIKDLAPQGSFSVFDENTLELLARIFDYIYVEQNIPPDFKKLINRLQIPILKAALIDHNFFFRETHPARRLVEHLARSGMVWDQGKGHDDPLYQMAEQIVERVQREFEQQIALFSDVVSDLEAFLELEGQSLETDLSEPIARAMRQERLGQARLSAEEDVARQIATGEVAGFVESFLENQWTRVLTLAHSVKETKPDALVQARKTMDDLIWSVKPKSSPEQRKALVARLPALLSMINAWLNAIKWDEPERVLFFSHLVERHAAMARVQLELSPRRQVELAVNVAQRASERRMSMRVQQTEQQPQDEFARQVNDLVCGQWIAFSRANGERTKFKLAWISPQRGQFILTTRQGHESFSFGAGELAQTLRDHSAEIVSTVSVIDRALAAALDEIVP